MARILKIKVPLRVEIARRRATVKEVIAFKPGTVIEFEKNSEDLLDLCAGYERVAKGEAVKVGESFGMRVLEVSTVRDRIKSLGQ
jgi:flagellar motor switch protein FliN